MYKILSISYVATSKAIVKGIYILFKSTNIMMNRSHIILNLDLYEITHLYYF